MHGDEATVLLHGNQVDIEYLKPGVQACSFEPLPFFWHLSVPHESIYNMTCNRDRQTDRINPDEKTPRSLFKVASESSIREPCGLLYIGRDYYRLLAVPRRESQNRVSTQNKQYVP